MIPVPCLLANRHGASAARLNGVSLLLIPVTQLILESLLYVYIHHTYTASFCPVPRYIYIFEPKYLNAVLFTSVVTIFGVEDDQRCR